MFSSRDGWSTSIPSKTGICATVVFHSILIFESEPVVFAVPAAAFAPVHKELPVGSYSATVPIYLDTAVPVFAGMDSMAVDNMDKMP